MSRLALKVPPALLMLIFGGLMWLNDRLLPETRLMINGHEVLTVLITVPGVLCVLAGIISFRLARTTVDPLHPERASSVVTSGIYRWTRNPMYLGFGLLLLAFAVKLSNPVVVLWLPVFVWYMNRFQIIPEEQALERQFGDQYRHYCEHVRRWI